MLGVQLYDLISKAGMEQQQVVTFYSFMTQLGMAAQAIDIVYQLNAAEESDKNIYQQGQSPLESLTFGANGTVGRAAQRAVRQRAAGRVSLSRSDPAEEPELEGHRRARASARAGRVLPRVFRASASCSASRCSPTRTSPTISTRRRTSRSRRFTSRSTTTTRCSSKRSGRANRCLEVRFGLKVQVRALKDVDALLNGVAAAGRHDRRGDARRQDRLPQRLGTAAERSAPPRPRARRALSAQGLQDRLSRLEQSRRCSMWTTSCSRPARAATCC